MTKCDVLNEIGINKKYEILHNYNNFLRVAKGTLKGGVERGWVISFLVLSKR